MPTPADLPPAYALTAVFVTTLLPFVPYFWLDRLSVTGPRHLAHTVSHQAEQERIPLSGLPQNAKSQLEGGAMITTTCDETSDRPLVVITYASVGSGHRSAAQATAQALEDLCG